MLARHGGLVKHQHAIEGINSRLDGMQAAILSAKLPHLPDWTRARQDTAKLYDAGLNQVEDVVVPEVAADRTHVYHLYTSRHPRRDALAAHLAPMAYRRRSTIRSRCRFSLLTVGLGIVLSSFRTRSGNRAGSCRYRCLRRLHQTSNAR
jgi:dTDP-4-amino-4,6-dideoxygalactose transaminase